MSEAVWVSTGLGRAVLLRARRRLRKGTPVVIGRAGHALAAKRTSTHIFGFVERAVNLQRELARLEAEDAGDELLGEES